jgi:O-antigen ligase
MTGRDWAEPDDNVDAAPRRGALSLLRGLVDWIVVALFLLLLVASPLPMGANRDWAWSPLAIFVGVLAVLCAAGLGARDGFRPAAGERTPLLVLIGCFAIFIAIGFLQMLPGMAPSGAARLYARAAEILGHAHAAVATLAIDGSREVLLKSLACGLIFAIARAICVDQRRARLLLMALAASALIVVAYALLMHVTTHSCYLGSYLKKQGDYNQSDHCLMSGTFVNSNSFACFLGMALVAVIALVFDGRHSRRQQQLDYGEEEGVMNWLTGPKLVLIALAIVFLGGLLISGSRGGFGASVLGTLILAILMMRGSWRSPFQLRGAILVSVLFAIVVGLIAGGALVQKMSTLSEGGSANRTAIWRASIAAIRQSPWLGWGLGSYADIYTILQPPELTLPNDKAHSTPIETIVEVGIPAAVPTFMIVLVPWLVCLQGARQRRRHRALPAAAFAVSGVAILHSTIDFSLQIPAIAFWVSALLGLGWAQTFGRSAPPPRYFTEAS